MILRHSKSKSFRAVSITFFGKENIKKSTFLKFASKLHKIFETTAALKHFTPCNIQSVHDWMNSKLRTF